MSDYPYPGLRAFRPEETDIFFGRDEQTDELLERLDRSRFLAVVGPSGCGKSSLVRTGLLGSLHTGFLPSAGANWRVAEMRPRGHPMTNLALALLDEAALGSEIRGISNTGERGLRAAFLRAILQRGPLGLKEIIEQNPLPADTNLLLLVDQFEEIFRYRRVADRDQADAFVALLLASAAQEDVPLYVVITMRSDFLGDCALFQGLPEAINEGQYLTPRLTRDQLAESIEAPAEVFGGGVDPALTNRLLNAMGSRQDQLPVLQHALMRMWTTARDKHENSVLTLADYHHVGELKEALSLHADEAFNELDGEQQAIAKDLFSLLTERSRDLRDTRRPVELGDVARVAGCDVSQVIDVVEVFRRSDRSFLMPPLRELEQLSEETLLDISHESLIRQWDRLNAWVEREARSAENYRRLEETARLWEQDKAGLWGTPDLEIALQWRQHEQPNEAWAQRYGRYFPLAIQFLDASREKQEQDRADEEATLQAAREDKVRRLQDKLERQVQQRELKAARDLAAEADARSKAEEKSATDARARAKAQRLANLFLIAGLLFAIPLTVLSVWQWQKIVDKNQKIEEDKNILATTNKKLADTNTKLMEQHEIAKTRADELQQARDHADQQRRIAEEEQKKAKQQARVAGEQTQKAIRQELIADERRRQAQALLPAVRASDYLDDQLDLALLLNLESERITSDVRTRLESLEENPTLDYEAERVTSDARASLVEALEYNPRISRFLHGHDKRVNAVAYSPDGTHLASAGDNNTVIVYDLRSDSPGPERLGAHDHKARVNALAYSPNGEWLASASKDKTIILRNVVAGEVRKLSGHSDGVASVAFSPDSQLVASASWDDTVRIWRVDDRNSPPQTLGHRHDVLSVAFSPDGGRLASAGSSTVYLWNLDSVEAPSYSYAHADVTAVAFSPDGRWLAFASRDKTISLLDLEANEPTIEHTLKHDHPVLSMAFNKDGTELVSGTRDGSIVRWRLSEWLPPEKTATLSGHSDWVKSVAFHPDGRHLATASGGTTGGRVILWDLDARQRLGKASEDVPPLFTGADVSVSDEGSVLVNGRAVSLLDDASSNLIAEQGDPEGILPHYRRITGFALSPDGATLATGARDNTVVLWDLEHKRTPAYTRLTGHKDWINSVAFSPDGSTLASSSRDATIMLWNVAKGRLAGQFVAPEPADTVTFSRDGKQLASFHDNSVILWELDVESWRERACAIANRNLTAAERRRFFEDEPESTQECACPPCE